MLQKAHIQNFQKCKKYMPSDKERYNLKYNITKCIPLMQYFIKQYNIDNPDELRYVIRQYADSVFTDFMQSKYIDSRLYELQAMKSILKDPSIIDREYERVKDKPNTHLVYTADLNRSQKLVIVNALDEITKLEKYAKENDITANTNLDHVIIRHENPKAIKDFLKFSIKMLNQKSIKDKLLLMIDTQVRDCESFIRENEKASLHSVGMFLSSLGYLDRYLNLYENQSIKYGFDDLKYRMTTDASTGEIGLQDIFESDFLDTLPTEDLCFLDAFWCSKFAKEWTDFNSAFTAIDSMNLWQNIIDGKTDLYIKNESLDACIKKSNYLTQLTSETFNMLQNNIESSELKQGTRCDVPLSKDYSSYYMQLHNYIGEDYKKYFSAFSLTNNEFIENLSFSSIFVNLRECAYRKKTAILEPLIKSRLDDNYCKNWGLVRDEIVSGKLVDSIDTSRPRILVAFDIEGFDMPFCYHEKKESVTDLAKLSPSTYMIPEYQGNDDFIRYDEENDTYENITSNIIMPIPKSHKKIIMDNANSEGPAKNFWEHKYFLMNGKFPKHLTQTVQKSKKQTVTTRLPIIYTNLKTGKRYIKEKNQFIEVDDSNVR